MKYIKSHWNIFIWLPLIQTLSNTHGKAPVHKEQGYVRARVCSFQTDLGFCHGYGPARDAGSCKVSDLDATLRASDFYDTMTFVSGVLENRPRYTKGS